MEMILTDSLIYSNTQYPHYEVFFVFLCYCVIYISQLRYAPNNGEIDMDVGQDISGLDDDSTQPAASSPSSQAAEEICTVCGDKATKYRYSHYGQYNIIDYRKHYYWGFQLFKSKAIHIMGRCQKHLEGGGGAPQNCG